MTVVLNPLQLSRRIEGVPDSEGEQIEPKAFAATIAGSGGRVPVFLDHNRERWAGSSLSLVEDAKGLHMEAMFYLDTAAGREAAALLRGAREGCPVGLNIGFTTKQARFEGGVRKLSEVQLWEISLTPWPANPQALAA